MTEEKTSTRSEKSSPARRGLIRRVWADRPQVLPPAFHEHARMARKEALLALRSLIDARIERLEQVKEKSASQKRTHKVKVE